MQLKTYQEDALATLRGFLEDARLAGPKGAYEAMTREPELATRLGRYGGSYIPLEGFPDTPYVCLRLPTGGGKTLLGAKAISVARDAWAEKDYPMVLWLTPTNTIRLQTVEALKDPRHAYRQTLDESFGGRVRVLDIADFTQLPAHDILDHCCVIVGTIQTLRVKDTIGRKVYAHNENLQPHFSPLPRATAGLEKLDDGGVKFSFANLLHIERPLMIVDEAHGAVTGLTREMQARVNPAAIIEFTATPHGKKSNILYSATAQELKKEDMIKLPVMLSEHDGWENAVSAAVAARARLAKVAESDADYIRPIVLFQAQKKNQAVTVEVLKRHLIETERVAADKIAIATGEQRELDGINLFDPACAIEYVITVEALKEGWDCSFAYVFCSVSRIAAARDVEQLLGRVLRMPYALRRRADELNRAYAFVSEPTFGEAARALTDKLIRMGFEEEEARENIQPAQQSLDTGEEQSDESDEPQPTFTHTVTAPTEVIRALEKEQGVAARAIDEATYEVTIAGPISEKREAAIVEALPEPQREPVKQAIKRYRERQAAGAQRALSPAERGAEFKVPRLMAQIQGELEFADSDIFSEYHDWSLLEHSAKIGEDEFAVRATANLFEIDLDGKRVTYQTADKENQLSLDVEVAGWTRQALVLWLDRQTRQPDIRQQELLRWLGRMVDHLTDTREIHITTLTRCKFLLARKVRDKLAAIRQTERGKAYQNYLFAPTAKPLVSFNTVFEFKESIYPDERRYRGPWQPKKHFLGPDRVAAFDGADTGEEFQCAQALDSLPAVRFWLRNVARGEDSFWLPTATDKFYPDFVAQLEDGRLLVVEYKGAHLADTTDTKEKRLIGELWQRQSGGRGLFIVVEREVGGEDMRGQLLEKIR